MCSIRNTYHLPSLKISSIIYFKSGNDVSCFLFMTNCYTNSVICRFFSTLAGTTAALRVVINCSGFVLDKFLFCQKWHKLSFFYPKTQKLEKLKKAQTPLKQRGL